MFSDRTNWNLKSNRLSEARAGHRAAGKPLLDLTASNPTECGFDYDRQAILQALANPCSLSYDPHPQGLLVAREAVAKYYLVREINVPVEDIILATSTSEAPARAILAVSWSRSAVVSIDASSTTTTDR